MDNNFSVTEHLTWQNSLMDKNWNLKSHRTDGGWNSDIRKAQVWIKSFSVIPKKYSEKYIYIPYFPVEKLQNAFNNIDEKPDNWGEKGWG
jgi:hypothetical protein